MLYTGSETDRDFKWIDIADGLLLPVGLFLVPSKPDPDFPRDNWPTLILSDNNTIRITSNENAGVNHKVTILDISNDDIVWFRHYRQDADGLHIVSPKVSAIKEDSILSKALFLPLVQAESRDGIIGKKCVVLLQFNKPADDRKAYAHFLGIIDVWMLGIERLEFDEIVLHPPPVSFTN